MNVEYWLISGDTRLRLPVNPEVNSYSSPFTYTDTEVEGIGEVTTVGNRGQREFTISTFWPRDYNPVYCSYSNFVTPHHFLYTVEKWRTEKAKIQYIVTGVSQINRYVTIRDFQIHAERAGSPGDLYFSMTLKQFNEPKVARIDTSAPKNSQSATGRPAPAKELTPKSYTVKSGDSLWVISKRVYGDGNEWRKIYDANKKTIGANPNSIRPGQKLVIPK